MGEKVPRLFHVGAEEIEESSGSMKDYVYPRVTLEYSRAEYTDEV